MESNLQDHEMVWLSYVSVEDSFLDYLNYVPLSHGHELVWSPKLANLLLSMGSLIDSIFRRYLNSPTMDSAIDIAKIRKKDSPNINDFQEIYEYVYRFSNKKVYIRPTGEKLTPWSNWKNHKSPPNWWTAYNKVKHNRFKNKKEANLGNTLNALSGLFLACVILKEIRPYLVDIGIIKWTRPPLVGTGDLKQLLKEDEPIKDAFNPIIAQSKLFGYIFKSIGRFEEKDYYFSKKVI